MENMSIVRLFRKYVKNTEKEAIVTDSQILIGSLTNAVVKAGSFKSSKVYINTRVLKHLYDKRPAEEFDFIIHNIWQIVRYPDSIFLNNKGSKRGHVAFVKKLNKFIYFCSIEISKKEDSCEEEFETNFVVTIFRTDTNYLKKYELIWSWKGGTPSS